MCVGVYASSGGSEKRREKTQYRVGYIRNVQQKGTSEERDTQVCSVNLFMCMGDYVLCAFLCALLSTP